MPKLALIRVYGSGKTTLAYKMRENDLWVTEADHFFEEIF